MTVLKKLHQTIKALDDECQSLIGYTDAELQEIFDMLETIEQYRFHVSRDLSRREFFKYCPEFAPVKGSDK